MRAIPTNDPNADRVCLRGPRFCDYMMSSTMMLTTVEKVDCFVDGLVDGSWLLEVVKPP